MKKLILFTMFIACVCAFAIIHTDDSDAAVVASGTCGTNLNWEYDDATTTLTISGSGTRMTNWASFGSVPYYQYLSYVTNIVLDTPNLTNIANYAFMGSMITSIELPDTITQIGTQSFIRCSNLNISELPRGITVIGAKAFEDCRALELASLPEGITRIETYTFYNTKCTFSELPNTLTYIGSYAFVSTKITISEIPVGVTSIGEVAFYDCKSITSIQIPSTVNSIGNRAFTNCTGLQHIEFDAANCTIPTSGTFPFAGCSNIREVTIGENVESLPNYLFYENSAVTTWTTIYWNAINCADFSQDNMIFHNDKVHTVIFGDNVRHVPAYLTREFTDTLESVSFNDGLESIGDGAFQNSEIVVLGLPSSVKSVGVWTFSNCPNVMIHTLPNGMESIGSNAFANCIGIEQMLIPVGFSATISDGAFANDTNLKTILNLSDLDIEKGATTYGSIALNADEVRDSIPSVAIVQQKDHIVHEEIEKSDTASLVLRLIPVMAVLAILSFIIGALYMRSIGRDLI